MLRLLSIAFSLALVAGTKNDAVDTRTLVPSSVRIDFYFGTTTLSGQATVDQLISQVFNPSNPTFFVTHGWQNSITDPWVIAVKNALLAKVPTANVFLVDWSAISQNILYPVAKAQTVYVGSQLANFIKQNNLDPATIHLIGHSLGSHVAGVTGYQYTLLTGAKLARITGLDPATPLYSNLETPFTDKLDKSDAVFVDTIFTSMAFFRDIIGVSYSVGHVNFFPNGGDSQPGCLDEISLDLTQYLSSTTNSFRACSHSRAIDLFIDSLAKGNIVGYKCSYPNLVNGACYGTTSNKLGYPASAANMGDFVLTTTAKMPFANDDFNLIAAISSIDVPLGAASGTLSFSVASKNILLANPLQLLSSGKVLVKFTPFPAGTVTKGSIIGSYWSTISLLSSGAMKAIVKLATPDYSKTLVLGNPAVLLNGAVTPLIAA